MLSRIAAVDVETTGLFPSMHDRIVEIAIVSATQQGEVVDEYVTLVNPERDVGPTHIHGVHAQDVIHAPRFEDIAGSILDHLAGAVVAGHNVRFDLSFIAAEFSRLGVQLPPIPAICTLTLASRLPLPIDNRRLRSCCEAFGIRHRSEHAALDDARATARLLGAIVDYMRPAQPEVVGGDNPLPAGLIGGLKRSDTVRTRVAAAADLVERKGYLSRLVSRLPARASADDRSMISGAEAYLDLLDRCLDDLYITEEEAAALSHLAGEWGMSKADVEQMHAEYLSALVRSALADGVVQDSEYRDLSQAAAWLGSDDAGLDVLISRESENRSSRFPPTEASDVCGLAGSSVCFTGQLNATIGGEPVTRDVAEEYASQAGLRVLGNVTRKLDILVTADPLSQSGKARKARTYGTRVIAESVFWRSIGVQVD